MDLSRAVADWREVGPKLSHASHPSTNALTHKSPIMPSTIYLVTGGCRSGKSGYAQRLCESLCRNPIYVATSSVAKYGDTDFEARVRRHQSDRGDRWTTIEEPLSVSKHVSKFKSQVVLVDCCTLWLTNFFLEHKVFEVGSSSDGDGNGTNEHGDASASTAVRYKAAEAAQTAIKEEFDRLVEPWGATFVFVTNEIGSGTHANNAVSRLFVDHQGWFNQYVAGKADQVIHMVSGCPRVIKDFPLAFPRRPVIVEPVTQEQRTEANRLDRFLSTRNKTKMDANGYFMLCLEAGRIKATFHSCMVNEKGEVCDLNGNKIKCCDGSTTPEPIMTWQCRTAKELTTQVFEEWSQADKILSVSHAAYIGREAQRAEHCLYSDTYYQQD